MSVLKVTPGAEAPGIVNVIIEIPAKSPPVKYEVDKTTGALFVDRFLSTPMFYPANYGYVPQTLAEDGDPVDVLVVTPVPLVHGVVIPTRLVGLLSMTDEKGPDAKLLGVPENGLSQDYTSIESYQQLPQGLLDAIEHFFSRYKELDAGKWVKLDGWQGVEAAQQEVNQSIARYANTQ